MRYLIYIFLIVVIYSCNSKAKTETELALKELVLDNGKPWLVNNATQIGITKMDSLIKNFTLTKDKNYTYLGKLLSKQTSFIIKKCSMKGTAHDQLHIVLIPMLDEISIMKESHHIAIKKTALAKLQIYIDKYFEHFTIE